VRQCGYLDAFAINYFFRDIQKMLAADEQMVVPLEDIKDELYDMCRPKHASRITLRDLIESKNAATIIGILIDLEAFYKYENREYLGPENDGDDTVAINEVDSAEEDATELQI
jgi:serine/threonine-protein phosphatase 2A regulatory subunit B''